MRITTAHQYWGALNAGSNTAMFVALLTRSRSGFLDHVVCRQRQWLLLPAIAIAAAVPSSPFRFWVLGLRDDVRPFRIQTISQPTPCQSLVGLQSRQSPPIQRVDSNVTERRYALIPPTSRRLECRHVTQVADHFKRVQSMSALKIAADACLAISDVPGPPTQALAWLLKRYA